LVTTNIPENSTHFSYDQKNYFKENTLIAQGYSIDGIIHTWSGGTSDGKDKDNNPTKMGPDATELIINFFLH
jgi:poly(3-hydroxybutyrate) depolymerase